jgi:RecA-family ATPase
MVRAADLESPVHKQSWLIERLWTHQAVGIIGGSPKSGKTWLALEMAVSVASGSPCLDSFTVFSPGPVLLYAAEDSAAALRTRVETLARLHKVDFNRLDVHIITVDSLRLDRAEHQDRLESTLLVYKPAMLVLDPLIRVLAIDENVAGQVSMLLGYLRSLQRKTGAAIALVPHVRKNASPTGAAGYSLRGSGDLYAWLDSFLYLQPLTIDALRSRLQVRNQRVVEALRILASEGRIVRNTRGFSLPPENKPPVQMSW